MKKKIDTIREEDLYAPVRDYLIAQGYTVRGEVRHCDIAAEKDGEFLIVELKLTLSIELILQAVQRQKLSEIVYIAIPKPKRFYFTSRGREILHLLRRLELGLFLIGPDLVTIEAALLPKPFDRNKSLKQNTKRRKAMETEFKKRHGDFNTGGSTGKKLMTAYKEDSLLIAMLLKDHKELSPKKLKSLGSDEKKTQAILRNNVYGWFEWKSRGIYSLTDEGKKALKQFKAVIAHIQKDLDSRKSAIN